MKHLIKTALRSIGLDIRRYRPAPPAPPRIANIQDFLADVKARGFQPRGIIDVGANHGNWTRMTLSFFPGTPVIMIEPQDEMESGLSELCKITPGCRLVKAGVGRAPGELNQTIWEDLAGSSFLPTADDAKQSGKKQRKTRIVTIDSILNQSPDFSPDLVKLDIQGFELEALSGANALFDRTELFVMETSLFSFMPKWPITREVIAFMAQRDYELYDITECLRRPRDGALGQVDLAFAKRNGQLRKSSEWD